MDTVKYIDPNTWELVTRHSSGKVSRSSNLNKVLAHLKEFNR